VPGRRRGGRPRCLPLPYDTPEADAQGENGPIPEKGGGVSTSRGGRKKFHLQINSKSWKVKGKKTSGSGLLLAGTKEKKKKNTLRKKERRDTGSDGTQPTESQTPGTKEGEETSQPPSKGEKKKTHRDLEEEAFEGATRGASVTTSPSEKKTSEREEVISLQRKKEHAGFQDGENCKNEKTKEKMGLILNTRKEKENEPDRVSGEKRRKNLPVRTFTDWACRKKRSLSKSPSTFHRKLPVNARSLLRKKKRSLGGKL